MTTTTGSRRTPGPGPARRRGATPSGRAPRPLPPTAAQTRRDAAGSAVVASVAVVAMLWAAHSGIADLVRSPAAQLTSLGRLAGLVSADLLLVQVLLMARIPWIERAVGQDALARHHRIVGFTSFVLMVAHVALITAGYAATDHRGLAGEGWDLTAHYPGMLLAVADAALAAGVPPERIHAERFAW